MILTRQILQAAFIALLIAGLYGCRERRAADEGYGVEEPRGAFGGEAEEGDTDMGDTDAGDTGAGGGLGAGQEEEDTNNKL